MRSALIILAMIASTSVQAFEPLQVDILDGSKAGMATYRRAARIYGGEAALDRISDGTRTVSVGGRSLLIVKEGPRFAIYDARDRRLARVAGDEIGIDQWRLAIRTGGRVRAVP